MMLNYILVHEKNCPKIPVLSDLLICLTERQYGLCMRIANDMKVSELFCFKKVKNISKDLRGSQFYVFNTFGLFFKHVSI